MLMSLYACSAQVIKAYPQGKMSQHIHGLEVGDSLEIKGPMSKLPYTPNMKEKIGMVSPHCSLSAHHPNAACRISTVCFWPNTLGYGGGLQQSDITQAGMPC